VVVVLFRSPDDVDVDDDDGIDMAAKSPPRELSSTSEDGGKRCLLLPLLLSSKWLDDGF